MDLKHIEELAKDKDITNAYFCHCLSCFDKLNWEEGWCDHDNYDKIKEWKDLTNEEKEELIDSAIYYWTKDQNDTSIGRLCDCVMLNQYDILHDNMDKWEFLDELCKM